MANLVTPDFFYLFSDLIAVGEFGKFAVALNGTEFSVDGLLQIPNQNRIFPVWHRIGIVAVIQGIQLILRNWASVKVYVGQGEMCGDN